MTRQRARSSSGRSVNRRSKTPSGWAEAPRRAWPLRPDPARSLDLHVRNICWMLQRVVPLLRALESAAAVDEEAAALWADFRRQRRTGTAGIAANLAAKTRLRCPEPVLADMLLSLPPDAHYRLVREEGWPVETFQRWLADLLKRACLP